jgi:hypothetical protein
LRRENAAQTLKNTHTNLYKTKRYLLQIKCSNTSICTPINHEPIFFLRRRRSTAKAAQLEDRLLNPTAFRRRVGGRRPPTRGLVPHAYRSLSSSSSLHCQQLELLDHCSLAHATARLSSHGYAIYLYTISVCLFTTNVETFHACFGVRAGETTVAMRRADGAGDLRSRCLFGKEVIF